MATGAAKAVYPGGAAYVPVNIALICFFNYFYTFLQLEPKDVAGAVSSITTNSPTLNGRTESAPMYTSIHPEGTAACLLSVTLSPKY